MFEVGQKLKIIKKTKYYCCPSCVKEGEIIIVEQVRSKRNKKYRIKAIRYVGSHLIKLTNNNAELIDG